jgi:hypothetical protein
MVCRHDSFHDFAGAQRQLYPDLPSGHIEQLFRHDGLNCPSSSVCTRLTVHRLDMLDVLGSILLKVGLHSAAAGALAADYKRHEWSPPTDQPAPEERSRVVVGAYSIWLQRE